MTKSHLPTLIAASLVLAIATSAAMAQGTPAKAGARPAGKTLSGNAASGGKPMTRDELRTCLKRLDDVNRVVKDGDGQRLQLDREREELQKSGEALKVELAEVERLQAAVREWEAKTRALAVDIESFNKRSAELQDAPHERRETLTEALKVDRERLQKARDVLAAEEAQRVPAYQSSAKAYNERAAARDARVGDWNQRHGAVVDASVKHEEARLRWVDECANRLYLEDDEKAIKAGK
jgi:chromosome segregation ATPase